MRQRNNTAIYKALTLALIGGSGWLVGCGGTQTTGYELSPENLLGGNKIAATDTLAFSGRIRNNSFTTPRFFVQTPVDEPLYRPGTPITATNVLHGTIAETDGVYTAPSRLAGVDAISANNNTDVIAVIDQGTDGTLHSHLKAIITVSLQKWQELGFATDTTTKAAVKQVMTDALLYGDPDTVNLALRTRKNPVYSTYNDYVAGAQTGEILWEWLVETHKRNADIDTTPTVNGIDYQEEILRRMVAALDASVRLRSNSETDRRIADTPLSDQFLRKKTTVRLDIVAQVKVDPQTADVSIRDSVPLNQFIKTPGDQDLCDDDTGCVFLKDRVSVAEKEDTPEGDPNVKYTIENPTQGAGGKVDRITGRYTAPLTLPDAAFDSGNERQRQDVVLVTLRSGKVVGRITVNVVVADAPTNVEITDSFSSPRPAATPSPVETRKP